MRARQVIPLLYLCFFASLNISRVFAQRQNDAKPTLNIAWVDHLNEQAGTIFLTSPDSAKQLAEEALILSRKINYSQGMGESFFRVGQVYWSQSYYPIAIFYMNRALEYLPKNKTELLADCYGAIGRTYADEQDYSKALKYLDLSEQLVKNYKADLAGIYGEKSIVYMRLGQYPQALNFAMTSLKLNRQYHNNRETAVMYARLGAIYAKMRRYDQALSYSDTGLVMGNKVNNKRLRALLESQISTIYTNLHDYDHALIYAQLAFKHGTDIGVIDAVSKSYKQLIDNYRIKHNTEKVINLQKRYIQIQDSVSVLNKVNNNKLIQDYFSINARLNAISDIEIKDKANTARIRLQNIIIVILVITLFIGLVLISVIYRFYTQKKRLNSELNKQHDALIEQNKIIENQASSLKTMGNIKDKLLAVIGHDMRSPIASLSNIIDMYEQDYLTVEEVNTLVKEVNPLIKGAQLTLSNLVNWASNQMKGDPVSPVQVNVHALGMDMETTFRHELQKKNITFTNNLTDEKNVWADENHVKVVLRNLISNAIKFTNVGGSITLSSDIVNSFMTIAVTDTGEGMSDEQLNNLFNKNTHFTNTGTMGETGTGLGLMLCKELVELNGGKINVTSVRGEGTAFYFNLPLR